MAFHIQIVSEKAKNWTKNGQKPSNKGGFSSPSDQLAEFIRKRTGTGTCMAFLQYVRFSCVSSYGQLWKVTLLTFVRLFSRVDLFVLPHIWQFIWRISTLAALMRLYPCVSHNVGFQSTSLSGWVFALCTFVRLLPRMSDQVSFQISSKTKWFAALFTNALSNVQLGRMTCCIVHTYVISLQCESSCGF